MEEPEKLELYQREINYLLVALELFSLNLNSIWTIKKDREEQDITYADIFHLYHYLNSKTNYSSCMRLERPKKNKIINFK